MTPGCPGSRVCFAAGLQHALPVANRLAALDDLAVLDTLPEQRFDDIVRLATCVCATPVAPISLVGTNRRCFKARIGFRLSETDLNSSVCADALSEPDPAAVPLHAREFGSS